MTTLPTADVAQCQIDREIDDVDGGAIVIAVQAHIFRRFLDKGSALIQRQLYCDLH
jgi:hypothetical protein